MSAHAPAISSSSSSQRRTASQNTAGHDRTVGLFERIAQHLSTDEVETLAPAVRVALEDDEVRAMVPSEFHASFLRKNLQTRIESALRAEFGERHPKLRWSVTPEAFPDRTPAPVSTERPAAPQVTRQPTREPRRSFSTSAPAKKYRLDDYVVSRSNSLAVTAAKQLVHAEAEIGMNVMFLHGPCGVGKTHLLNGIANAVLTRTPTADVRCVTAEAFANAFISAVQRHDLDAFRAKYRSVDLLCIDDVHFLAGKDKTQAEMLHTFDALDLSGARIVLCSDEHPKRVHKFNQRLVSRCVSQMVVGIEAPDRDLRIALAQRLAMRRSIMLDEEAAGVIADRFTASVREIEGGICNLNALLQSKGLLPGVQVDEVGNRRVTARFLTTLLGGTPGPAARKPIPVSLIAEVVCEQMGIELSDLFGDGRHRQVVLARSVAAVLARSLTSQSFPEIARAMNRRNHSTIITAHQRGTKLVEEGVTRDAGPRLGELSVSTLVQNLKDEVLRRSC